MSRYPKGACPKLTNELIEKITVLIRKGSYVETAVAFCGISKDTFYRWLRQGAQEEAGIYRKLSDAIWVAQAESEIRDLEIIDKAAYGTPDKLASDEHGNLILDSKGNPVVTEYGLPPNWKASAWRLERKSPARWGKKVSLDLNEIKDNNIEITFVDPKTEDKAIDQIEILNSNP